MLSFKINFDKKSMEMQKRFLLKNVYFFNKLEIIGILNNFMRKLQATGSIERTAGSGSGRLFCVASSISM